MVTCDFLVIGSGIGGLTFALKAADYGSVVVVTKADLAESNSTYAQGGIASVWSHDDSFESHIADTIRAGAGLCHPEVVDSVVREGPDRIRELIALGTRFSLNEDSEDQEYDLAQEGGHSNRRILHASDMTGREIQRALMAAVRRKNNIQIFEHHLAFDLLVDAKFSPRTFHPQCWGAYVLDQKANRVSTVLGRATVLATGGIGKVYLYTSNPDVATGDGLAAAYRAGVPVANMEFVQFHPTCLFHPKAKSFLISEALRGEGGVLRLPDGNPFMKKYDSRGDLAPRDIVARAIDHEMKVHGFEHVYLDISHKPSRWVQSRFPTIYRKCLEFGIDITTQPTPVVPAAHYLCGGVITDRNGATPLSRLYACGEVAHTGLHGANRLGSNSLLEAVVFAHRAFLDSRDHMKDQTQKLPSLPDWNPGHAVDSDESVVVSQNWDEIRRLMWNYVGIVRSNKRLARARERIRLLQQEIQEYYWDFNITSDLVELRNIATVAELIICSAQIRKESRGLHAMIDYPKPNDLDWKKDTILRKTLF
jgi:L-aspartate oxidase